MIIGALTIELQVPASQSLKDKRRVRKSLVDRLRNRYNIAVAEVDHLDSWQLLTLGIVAVANDKRYLQGLLDHVLDTIESEHREFYVLSHEIEII